nr:pentatricopeptide repeat-containing protein, mitochondrial [Quercus suber]
MKASTQRALALLDQCLSLTMTHVKQIQCHLTVSGTLLDPHAATKIISFCAVSDHGDLNHAYQLFHHLPNPSKLIWNTMVRAFAEKNEPIKAVCLYKNMLHIGFLPNNYTFSFLLRACAHLSDISLGKIFHAQVVRLGWESYDFVQNGLIHLYATCDCMESARKLFDTSVNRDVITWTALINGYVKSGLVVVAREERVSDSTRSDGGAMPSHQRKGLTSGRGRMRAAIFFQNIGADESKYSESPCPVGPMPEPYHDACKANPMPSHCFRHPFGSSCRYQDHLLLRSVRPWRLEPRLSTFSPFTQSIQTHLEHHVGDRSHAPMEEIMLMLLAIDTHLKFSWHDDDSDDDIDCDKINE